jgi:4-hydroxybenzoate polyprenyltransferase
MRIRPLLQLVRLPNLFTAAADPLAGWLLVGGSVASVAGWGPLAASGVATYAAGMILNDVFDYRIDLAERPWRPLPSGQISRRFAAWLGGLLLILGPCLAAIGGTSSLLVSLALSACVLAYDGGLKRTPLGPEAMGACRSLNLLLGMSQAPDLGGPAGWLAAGMFGLFVVGVTWISRNETEAGKTRGVVLGMVLQDLALIGLLAAALQVFPFPGRSDARPIVPPEGLLVLLLTAWVINLADSRALREPVPARLQAAVKTGVLSLVWLDVGLVASVRGVGPALAVAGLWVPAFLLGKWLYST